MTMLDENEEAAKSAEEIEKELRDEVVSALAYYKNIWSEEYSNISAEYVNFADITYQNHHSAINYTFLLNGGAAAALCSISNNSLLNGHGSNIYFFLAFFAVGILISAISLACISKSRSYYFEFLKIEKDRFSGMIYLIQKEMKDETFKPESSPCFEVVSKDFKKVLIKKNCIRNL